MYLRFKYLSHCHPQRLVSHKIFSSFSTFSLKHSIHTPQNLPHTRIYFLSLNTWNIFQSHQVVILKKEKQNFWDIWRNAFVLSWGKPFFLPSLNSVTFFWVIKKWIIKFMKYKLVIFLIPPIDIIVIIIIVIIIRVKRFQLKGYSNIIVKIVLSSSSFRRRQLREISEEIGLSFSLKRSESWDERIMIRAWLCQMSMVWLNLLIHVKFRALYCCHENLKQIKRSYKKFHEQYHWPPLNRNRLVMQTLR